jgi:hypothetical protein
MKCLKYASAMAPAAEAEMGQFIDRVASTDLE